MRGAPLRLVAPSGCPSGVDPSAWRKALAERIEQLRDAEAALIDALDSMEPDPDLEEAGDELDASFPEGNCCMFQFQGEHEDAEEDDPGENDGTAEPSLGAVANSGGSQEYWGVAFDSEDLEGTNEDGGDILDAPHDDGYSSGPDSEPSLSPTRYP